MCNAAPCPPSTCRCREPLVDKARPRTCYECGLPVAAAVRCPNCWGVGLIHSQAPSCIGEEAYSVVKCLTCKGTGRVPARHGAAKLDAIVQKVKEA